MENNMRKRNEMFMAYIYEMSTNGNECSLIDGHPNISFENTLSFKKTKRSAGVALETEVMALELRHHIQEARRKERELIGYELHDNVNQILASARLFVEMIVPSSQQDKDIQEKISELVRKAYEEIRMISRKLTSNHCLKNSLSNELQCLVDEIKLTRKYIVQFKHDFNEEYVSSLARINLYRIAQEQLKNILEYSKAKNIIISLKEVKDQLFFCIIDDGVGFDKQTYIKGLGHTNIFQRVEELKGKVEFMTDKGRGCSLLVAIPITNK